MAACARSWLLIAIAIISAASAIHIARFPDPVSRRRDMSAGASGGGGIVAAASAKLQWNVVVRCPLEWTHVTQTYELFRTSYTLGSSGASGTVPPPCKLTLVGQGRRQTLYVLNCDRVSSSYASQIKKLLFNNTYFELAASSAAMAAAGGAPIDHTNPVSVGLLPPGCGAEKVSVARDGVIRTQTSYSQSVANYWHLDRIDQRSLGLNTLYSYYRLGTGVTVYVLDTGIYGAHEEFADRPSIEFVNFVDDDIDEDCNGHGTFCASEIAGTNSGVAKNASLVAFKVLDCDGYGSFSGIILALTEIMDRQDVAPHPAVVSMSLAGGAYQPADDAVNALVTQFDVAVVVAAGNAGSNACNYSPARANKVLTVAATDRYDNLATYSNRGPCCNIAAPGTNLHAACPLSTTCYTNMSGTSMATPVVAGICALLLEEQVEANGTFSGALAQQQAVAMATYHLIDDPYDSFGPISMAFSSVGGTAVPQPPPPPPPPQQPQAPHPNLANPNAPLGHGVMGASPDLMPPPSLIMSSLALLIPVTLFWCV